MTARKTPTPDAETEAPDPRADPCWPVGGISPDATTFACEHGSWTFTPSEDAPAPAGPDANADPATHIPPPD